PEHPRLDGERNGEQEVVAWNAEQAAARHRKHRREEQPDEQARACLLDAEIPELQRRAAQARQLRARTQVEKVGVEYTQQHRRSLPAMLPVPLGRFSEVILQEEKPRLRWSMPKTSASQSIISSWPSVGLSCWQCSAPVSSALVRRSVTFTPLDFAYS